MVYDPFEWQTGAEGATPITAERLNALEQGVGDASQEIEGRLSEASLNSTYAQRFPLDARANYGVGASKTPAQNFTALQQAITDAIAQGRDLIIAAPRSETIDIAGTLEIPPGAEIRITGNPDRKTVMRSTVVGQPVFRVRGKATIENFAFTSAAGRSVSSLSESLQARGESQPAFHCGISMEFDSSGSVFRNIDGYGLHSVITTTGWDAALGAVSSNLSQDILMENISGEDVAFVILSRGVKDATYRQVRGTYSLTTGTAAPPHLVYLSEDTLTPAPHSVNVNLSDLTAWDGSTGAAVKFAGVDGGSICNVRTRNCRGVLDVMNVQDSLISDIVSLEDNASAVDPGPVKASVELLTCQRVTVSDVRVDGKSINFHRALAIREGSAITVRDFDAVVRHTALDTNEFKADIDVTSAGAVLENVSVTNLGVDRGSGFMLRNQAGIILRNPSVSGAYRYGVYHDSTASSAIVDADPNRLQVDTSIGGAQPFFIGTGSPVVNFRTPASPVTELDQPIAWHGRAWVNAVATGFFFWDSGQPVLKQSGTWQRDADGTIRNPSNGATDSAVVETGVANVDVQTRMKFGASSSASGVVFRAIDNSDYLLAALIGSGTVRILSRESGGATSTLAQVAFVPTVARYYDLRVIAHGDKVEVFVDGVLRLEHTLSPALQTKFGAATKHGLFGQGAALARWRALRVRATS